jgi:hypothetical protein
MVGCDQHHPRASRRPGALCRGSGDRPRILDPHLTQFAHIDTHLVTSFIALSTSQVVGIAVEHSSLEATMAPAALAKPMVRSTVHSGCS